MQELDFIEKYIKLISKEMDKELIIRDPKELYEPITYILKIGGKRLRPILVLLSAELFSLNPKIILSKAIAVELFHNFTLIHDDIMDNAPIRRNQVTIHNKWNLNAAILSGDAVLIKAYSFWGKKCVNYFDGMWAFAIFDKKKNEIFLSRDNFGEKPLYYYYDENEFIFGSEIKYLKYLS